MSSKVLTVEQVSKELGLSLKTTYKLIKQGVIPKLDFKGSSRKILIPVIQFNRYLDGKR